MPLNLYLTGFMGCGKSRTGASLAKQLKRPFLDMDERFAADHGGVSAGDYIRIHGEAEFRREEQALLRRLADECEFAVISTGGGVPAYPGNRSIMQNSGITCFLDLPLEAIERRLSRHGVAQRPLWNPDHADARRALYESRLPAYRQAEVTVVPAPGATPDAIAAEIRRLAADWLRAAPVRTRIFRRLLQQLSRDAAEFGLFAANDRILVGLSGGEDSLLLMHLLTALQRRLPFPVEILPATIDLGYPGFDRDALREYCQRQGWDLRLVAVPGIAELFEKTGGERPCALCSRLRRGKLHGLLAELNCNKLALGQHLNDLCVSFLLALFRGGGLKTMGPNVAADGGKARLIRPLWGCTKEQIHEAALFFAFPPIRSCPYEDALREHGDRFYLEQLLRDLQKRFPDLLPAMRHSLGDLRTAHLLDHRYLHDNHDPDAGRL